jgi:hypothetical protein
MNLYIIVTELTSAGITVRKFTVDYERKEIILDVNIGGDSSKLGDAMIIIEKHAAAYKAAGFRLIVSYGMLY